MIFTKEFLQKVVNTLLPGLPKTERQKAIPAASKIEIDQKLAQHIQTAHNRALIREALQAIVQQSGNIAKFVAADEAHCVSIMQVVEQRHSNAFQALLFTVSADYYESTAVLEAFDWRPTPPQPDGYKLLPFNELLLKSVKSKPKIWRE